MKALIVREHGGLDALLWEELPTPEPGPMEVRVRVRACAVNHLDLWVRKGVPGARFPLPLIPGNDVSGEVDAVGPGVEDLEVGTPVVVHPLPCPAFVGGLASLGRLDPKHLHAPMPMAESMLGFAQ